MYESVVHMRRTCRLPEQVLVRALAYSISGWACAHHRNQAVGIDL